MEGLIERLCRSAGVDGAVDADEAVVTLRAVPLDLPAEVHLGAGYLPEIPGLPTGRTVGLTFQSHAYTDDGIPR